MYLKYVARQAILDRECKTIGYELLYRNNTNNAFSELCNDKATSQVIIQNHLLGNLSQLCGGNKAFINFHDNTILEKFPLMFDKDAIVIELLETMSLSTETIDVIIDLHGRGYEFALDDYDFSPKWDVLLPYISIIKLDIEQTSYFSIKALKLNLQNQGFNIRLLAERVEEQKQFEKLKKVGVDYFQGYYFHKPELKAGKSISPLNNSLLLLFAEVYKPEIKFEEITKIIRHDVSLASGILKLVNSTGYSASVEITSIKQAVSFLGLEKIKQYLSIISMSQLSSESPNELFTESLLRAKSMEIISLLPPFKSVSHLAFITGMLSNLDVILQVPMSELTAGLPLDDNIKKALLNKDTLLTELLCLVKLFEAQEPDKKVLSLIKKHTIGLDTLFDVYEESLTWYEAHI